MPAPRLPALALAWLLLQPAFVHAQAASRGELLYATHCGACHTQQMHWREKRLANDWPSLLAQVRRWQGAAQLGWSDGEIEDVARYLNQAVYRHPEPARVGQLALPR